MKKYLFILILLLTILTVACEKNNVNNKNESDTTIESVVKGESLDGKATISSINISKGEISFKIENLTQDNTLLSAYLEYTCIRDGDEIYSSNLDAEFIYIDSGSISDIISFTPQKILVGDEIVIKFRAIQFMDDKDNYNIKL